MRWTRRLADSVQAPWLAVYVESSRPLTQAQQNQLNANLSLARQLGAEVITTVDDDLVRGLLRIARENNATQIVFGKSGAIRWGQAWRSRRILHRLVEESGDIDVLVVRSEQTETPPGRAAYWPAFTTDGKSYGAAALTTAAVTLLGELLRPWIGYQTVALVYLSAVLLLARFVGRGPILFAAGLTALCWDFLFVPPLYRFWISGLQDFMMFCMYFLVALATGQLTARLRLQQAAESRREQRASSLYRLTRELANATDFPQLLGAAIREVCAAFNADVAVLLPDGDAQQLVRYPAGMWVLDDTEESVSAWAFQHNQPAGRGTETLPQASGLHVPLSAGETPSGVIALRFNSNSELTVDQRTLLESFVRQIALVIDRQRLRDAELNADLLAQSEHLSRTLLNSVSHELRTPIAAITSANAALAGGGPLTPSQQALTVEIEIASTRLNRVVQNLLGAARLQSGHLKPQLDWCSVSELISEVLRGLSAQLKERR